MRTNVLKDSIEFTQYKIQRNQKIKNMKEKKRQIQLY